MRIAGGVAYVAKILCRSNLLHAGPARLPDVVTSQRGDDLLLVDYGQDSPEYWHASLQAAMGGDSTHQAAEKLVAAVNRILKHARQTYPDPAATRPR
jgi:hypothetical protein